MNKIQKFSHLFMMATVIDIKRFILNTATDLLILGNRELCNAFVTKLSVSIYNDAIKFEKILEKDKKTSLYPVGEACSD